MKRFLQAMQGFFVMVIICTLFLVGYGLLSVLYLGNMIFAFLLRLLSRSSLELTSYKDWAEE